MIPRSHDFPTAFATRPGGVRRRASRPAAAPVVLAAVDVAGPPARSRSVLGAAAALRGPRGEGAALHVVYGWTLVGASILACPVRGLSTGRYRELLSRVGRRHRERVVELCEETLPCPPDGILVRRGDPRALIPDAARRLRADLVVLGGPSRSGPERLFLGSVARAVVDRVPCDVLTVREGYPW